jgi:hypothetical protein
MRATDMVIRKDYVRSDPMMDPLILEMTVLLAGLAQHRVILKEAALTADQIGQLFGDVEKKMVAAKSMAGKVLGKAGEGLMLGVKGLKTINDAKQRLIQAAQQTKAVAGFDNLADAAIAKLKKAIGSKFPAVVEGLEKYAEWAKKNPIKQALIIAALTAAVSFLSAPALAGWGATLGASSFVSASTAGAAAGFILRTLNSLLKGEKLSTSLLSGAIGGIAGYIAGMGIKELTHMFGDPAVQNFIATTDAGKKEVWLSSFREKITMVYDDPETHKHVAKEMFLDVMGTPEELEKLKDTFDKIKDAMTDGDLDTASALLKSVGNQNFLDYEGENIPGLLVNIKDEDKQRMVLWAGKFIGKDLQDVQSFNNAIENTQAAFRDKIVQLADGVQAAAQGAAAGATGTNNKTAAAESYQMTEADLKSTVGKVGAWAAQQSKQIMQKFTSEKMMKAWKSEGSPTNSDKVHELLVKLGVPQQIVKDTYADRKIPPLTADKKKAAGAAGTAPKSKTAAKDKTKAAEKPAATQQINTGNAKLDSTVNKIYAEKGKDAALKYLQDLKAKNTATSIAPAGEKIASAATPASPAYKQTITQQPVTSAPAAAQSGDEEKQKTDAAAVRQRIQQRQAVQPQKKRPMKEEEQDHLMHDWWR